MKKASSIQLVLGVAGLVCGIGLGFVFFHKAPVGTVSLTSGSETGSDYSSTNDVPPVASSGTAAGAHADQPKIVVGTPVQTSVRAKAAFDTNLMVSSSPYPNITGTANISQVHILVQNPSGVGIEASMAVPVVNGHWIYSSPLKLAPGTYTVLLGGAGEILTAKLQVQTH